MKTNKHLVFAAVAFMLTVALLAGLGNAAQAAPDAPTAQTWYCDPNPGSNRGIQFTLDNLASPGDTICLWPSATATTAPVTYYENVVVNYSVTILGLNHGRVAFDPRLPESYVYPKIGSSEAVFTIRADNVTIDGVFVGATGTYNGVPVNAEHGIWVDSEGRETVYVSDVHILNNFVESASEGIELDGNGQFSAGNVVQGNYVLRYFDPGTTDIGIQTYENMFATIQHNMVKNYEDALWVEGFDTAGTVSVINNIVLNTNFELCHGIYVYDMTGEHLNIIISTNTITSFIRTGAYNGVGIGVYDIWSSTIGAFGDEVQLTVSSNTISTVEDAMMFDALNIDHDYPVILSGNNINNIGDDAVLIWNDDLNDDMVTFWVSAMVINDVDEDAFEIYTDSDGSLVNVTLVSGVVITHVGNGFDIDGLGVHVTSPAPEFSNSMHAVEEWYFDIEDNMVDIDATRIAINGELGRQMNFTELFELEVKTYHAIDELDLGWVMYVQNTAYVAQENQIQYAIEVYDDPSTLIKEHTLTAETVFVQWGEYDGVDAAMQVDGVYIWRPVILTGVTSEWGVTKGDIPVLYYDTVNEPGAIIWIEDTEEVAVSNFELEGDGAAGLEANAIEIRANDILVHEILIADVEIESFNGVGINMTGFGFPFEDIMISNVHIEDMALQGIYLQTTKFAGQWDQDILLNTMIAIVDCDIENVLQSQPYGLFGAAVELYGIYDVLIEGNYFNGTNNYVFDGNIWYLSLIATSNDVDVIGNVFDSWFEYAEQNGVYVEIDEAGYYVYRNFNPVTPVFRFNEFLLTAEDDLYAIYYYEGDVDVGADIIDARYNFWWDNLLNADDQPSGNGALGPYSDPDHVINPNEDGTGAQVEDYIYFAPWYMDDNFRYLTVDVFISEDKNVEREYVDGVDEVYYTIQGAVDDAANLDWVIVNPGLYWEAVEIQVNISLLGGYAERGMFEMPVMLGMLSEDDDIVCIDGEFVTAKLDYFVLAGPMHYLVHVDAANAIISNNVFEGSETGISGTIVGQVGILVEDYATANIHGNEFDEIAGMEDQNRGAIAVYSGSSADIYENFFWGEFTETAIWAWDVVEPLNIVDNEIIGFWFGVNIEAYVGLDHETSTGVYIAGNLIAECLVGISMDDVNETLIEENTIVAAEETPIGYPFDYTFDIMVNAAGENVVVVNNNLLTEGNADDTVGLWNAYSYGDGWENVIADNNFWGKASGPSGGFFYMEDIVLESYFDENDAYRYAWGGGTMVSINVTYSTWLNMAFPIGAPISAEFDAPIEIPDDMDIHGNYYSETTGIEIWDYTGDGYVVLGKYTGTPGKMFWGYNLGLYYEIAIWEESEDLDSLSVAIYFDESDVPVGVNIEELRLFFWDAFLGGWVPCQTSFVDVEEMCIVMTFDDDSLPTVDMLREDMAFMIGAPKLVITDRKSVV